MRPRLLGLAVLAALAVVALAGAGSASATTLCEVNENPCPEESRYPSGTTIAGNSASVLKSGTLTIECVDTKVEIKTLAESGSTIPAELTLPTFTECFDGATECTQEALNDPYEAFFYEPIGGNGRLANTNNPGDEFSLKVKCGASTCVFTGGMKFKITGGNPAKMTIFAWEPTQSGSCASTATWSVNYTLTTPTPLYVEASP